MKVDVLLRNGTSIPIDTSVGGGSPGPKGDKGDKGDTGVAGKDGKDGKDGAQGPKGDTGPSYTLPAATTAALGGVKQAAKQADLAKDAEAAAIVTGVNALMAALRDAGIIAK